MPGAKDHRTAAYGQRPPVDWGRRIARLFCLLFALVGLVPLSGGLLLRSSPVRTWAASETSRLLSVHLGMSATYEVELSLVPLRLEIRDLVIADTKRTDPAISAELIAISPRFFSLLAGRIDVGDIELENSDIRLELQDGQVQNIAIIVPDESDSSPRLIRSPFRTLAITNASLDVKSDNSRAEVVGIDLDVIAEKDLTFDLALRALGASLETRHRLSDKDDEPDPPKGKWAYDEDRLCALELRAQLSRSEINIRRLSLAGAVDDDARAGTPAICNAEPQKQLALRLSQFEIELDEQNAVPRARGNVMSKVPLLLVERLSPSLQGEGWAGFSGTIAYDERSKLPQLSGKLSGEHMMLSDYKIADKLSAELLLTHEEIHVPTMTAGWGNGEATFTNIEVQPFEEGMPLSIEHVSTHEVDFPGVMREVLVTDHSWVDWNFGETELHQVRGQVWPFYIDGAVDGNTHGFSVYDRGFDDPARMTMLGIPRATVQGRFRAHTNALEFYNCDLRFGTSHIPVELVSVGFFPQNLIVKTKAEGGTVDLKELGPIASLHLEGKSKVYADLKGPMIHPILKGTLSVEDLSIGGFFAGNIEESLVHFEPLFVEFSELKGRKGKMDYRLPRARLSFDGPAAVEFTSQVKSQNFSLPEFLHVFHFDEDPRFAELQGNGKVEAKVRYLLGGPQDQCGEGRLFVDGAADLKSAELLGESFSGASGNFSLDWFDIEAGLRGLSLYLPTVTLRKGSGSIFGSASVQSEGKLRGDLIGTQIPVSRLDLLPSELAQFDGFVTGSGQLGGSLEALKVDARLNVSELKMASASLGASQLQVHLDRFPEDDPADVARTKCGRAIPPPYVPRPGRKEGQLVLSGQLFSSQLLLDDFTITQEDDPKMSGQVTLQHLDLAQAERLTLLPGQSPRLDQGRMSGVLDVKEISVHAPFHSQAALQVAELDLKLGDIRLSLAEKPFSVRVTEGKVASEGLILQAKAKGGQTGIIDAGFALQSNQNLDAKLKLRPTNLAVLAAVAPAVKRAEGDLSAEVKVGGTLSRPLLKGAVDVKDGLVEIDGIDETLDQLTLHADLDRKGIHLTEGSGKFSGGNVSFLGELPLNEGKLGELDLSIGARRLHYQPDKTVHVTFDADLTLTALRSSNEGDLLPQVSGTVDILSGTYKKPMSLTADIANLTTRGEKTEISGYEINKDNFELDLLLRSTRPLTVENELVHATLRLDPSGLRLTGTDQKFGAVGTVEVENGGQIFLRRNEFDLKRGLVRFNDPTRLSPEVDVTAVTEYRRYNRLGGAANPGATNGGGDSSGGSTVGSGNWRISMHAYGAPENLKVDLTSDPPLGQDDIFLLLTVGLTRTELDQSRNSGVGSSVALEALGTLSGAESAVTDVVPVDEFRFGSTFSSRSGRTEPTVTIGKRLSNRIRASVTTSLSETSEVRSNVEYRATQNLSVEGSYDNARNVASAAGGNIGGDVRWRVEFR